MDTDDTPTGLRAWEQRGERALLAAVLGAGPVPCICGEPHEAVDHEDDEDDDLDGGLR